MKSILVTGVNGFVGNHLVNELTENNYKVIGVIGKDRAISNSRKSKDRLLLDLNKFEETMKIDFANIYGVVHLAGLASVGPSFDKPMDYITTNMGIEVNLYEAALKQGASPIFLIISSGALYDPKAKLPLTEKSATIPSSPYSVSKIGQESLASYYGSRGLRSIIARPFNHIGPGQGPGFIVPDLVNQIIANKKEGPNKILVGNLNAKRDYTDVRDIVRAYRLLLEKGRIGELYNICSGTALSGNKLLDRLLRIANVDIKVRIDPSLVRPIDVPVIYGDSSKLKKDVNWSPEINLDETLRDALEVAKNNYPQAKK